MMTAQALLDQFIQAKDRRLVDEVSLSTNPVNWQWVITITLKTEHNPRAQYHNLKRYLEAKGHRVSDLSLCNRLFYIFIDKQS